MRIKAFLTILRDLFLPQRRNFCPHCGGVHCIGACQFNEVKLGNGVEQAGEKTKQPIGLGEKKK